LGYNPSFAWSNIWKARQIFLLGCRYYFLNKYWYLYYFCVTRL
jgi:hypothetical protein